MKTSGKISKMFIAGLLAIAVSAVLFTACRAKKVQEEVIVKVGTSSDDPTIWNAVQSVLDARGEKIKIKIVNLADAAPNVHLNDGEIDLNAYQHYAYFNKNKADLNLDLTAIGDTVIVPLNLFSKKHKSLDTLPQKAKIALPSDPTNQGRALNVLRNAGLITLNPDAGFNGILRDITSNPKGITFVEMTGPQLPRVLDDVDAAIISCVYAVDAGLDPVNDPIYKDKVDLTNPAYQPFINIIAARTADKDNEIYKKIVSAYHTKEVADAIAIVYKNAAIPAFSY